ncbi:unnamed protein product [Tuber melanosporum]|uniref:(Perigord truffle) hypothetical protein n=1 Tax=Tuber melanosporum (strain Mel28) TaxID=656061 RepID=D5G688_TUBMM|nr:uncharacterized protein GSTUM_00001657001 [Tuber melanosporum]CAZ80031.1 unnamed protein product [Tuber melanosporum]
MGVRVIRVGGVKIMMDGIRSRIYGRDSLSLEGVEGSDPLGAGMAQPLFYAARPTSMVGGGVLSDNSNETSAQWQTDNVGNDNRNRL